MTFFFCTEQRPILIYLLKERKTNKHLYISLLFNRLLYVTFLYEIKEGRETFPTHLFDFSFCFLPLILHVVHEIYETWKPCILVLAQLFTMGHFGPKRLVEILFTQFFLICNCLYDLYRWRK